MLLFFHPLTGSYGNGGSHLILSMVWRSLGDISCIDTVLKVKPYSQLHVCLLLTAREKILTFLGVTVQRMLMMLLDFSWPSCGYFFRKRRLLLGRKTHCLVKKSKLDPTSRVISTRNDQLITLTRVEPSEKIRPRTKDYITTSILPRLPLSSHQPTYQFYICLLTI